MPELRIRLNRPQTLAHRALQRGSTVTIPWGRGVGKSWHQRFTWYSNIARWENVEREDALRPMRGIRVVHLMPTFKACRDIHGDLTEEELGPTGQWGWLDGRINHTNWRIRFGGGSWIQWFGTREANSARGLRCDLVTMDEADDIDPSVLDSIVRPWFSEPWSLKMLLIGGTPRRGRHGLLYREHRFGLSGDPSAHSFHATYLDAPETVDQGYILKVKAKTPPTIFRREYLCDFDSAEGLVYDIFEEGFHIRTPDPRIIWSEILVGVDHGYEDPGAFIVIGIAGGGADAVCHILEEVYEQHRTETWWIERAKEIRARYPRARWFADPSRPDRIRGLAEGAHVRFEPAKNPIEDGVAAVADRLVQRLDPTDRAGKRRAARLYISPRCSSTIAEFRTYRRRRDPRDLERVLDTPEDRNNHAMDALRYAIFTRFGTPEPARGVGEESIGFY